MLTARDFPFCHCSTRFPPCGAGKPFYKRGGVNKYMNMKKAITGLMSVAALSAVAVGASFAAPLTPGGAQVVPTITTETGTLITSQTDPFTALSGTYGGTLYSAVYKETGGTLDFIYQVKNNAGSTDALDRIAGGNFIGFNPDAFYSTQAGGLGVGTQAPNFAFETLSGGAGFKFDTSGNGNLLAGTTSDVLIIRTSATNFVNSSEGVSDNTTTNVGSYSPASAVPEPASVVTFALGGLALLGLIARKTRRTGGASA